MARGHEDAFDAQRHAGETLVFVDIAPPLEPLWQLVEYAAQITILDHHVSARDRFESDPGLFEKVKRFCGSPIPDIGDVGSFNASNPKRVAEYELHRDRITDRRIERWQREEDAELKAQAGRMTTLMGLAAPRSPRRRWPRGDRR